jgi:flagellar assembly protein FliH
VVTKPLSTRPFTPLAADHRVSLVTSGEEAESAQPVRFDRPLIEQPGWADPRISRQIAEAARAARQQGLAEGYAAGWAQGRRAAAEREAAEAAERADREEAHRRALDARTQALLAALAQAARTLADQVVPAWDGLVDTLLEGALAIVAAGLGRELAALDAEALEAARTALRLLPPTGEPVTLHVHPGDLELFEAAGARAAAAGVPGGGVVEGVRVVPDDDIPAGTVVARTALQSLPVDLRAALRSAEQVLRP